MSVIDWGDVPTWLGAVFAAGAAGAAVWTLASQRTQISEQQQFIAEQTAFMAEQRQNLELERAELREAAEDRRTAQARQVRMVFRTWGSSGEDEYGNDTGYDRWRVEVENGSGGPIHDVTVRFGDAYIAAWAEEREGIHHPDRGVRTVPVLLVPAGHTVVFESPCLSEVTVDNNRPALLFTDDGGVRWRRDSYGKLEEAPAEPGA